MTITLNGKPTSSGRICEPRVGSWWFEVELFSKDFEADPPSGRVVLDFFSQVQFVGTVSSPRTVNDAGTFSVRVEAGSGELDRQLPAAQFHKLTLERLVTALTQSTGDTVDSTSSETLLQKRVTHWTRPKTLAHRYLSDIAEKGGGVWRVLRNGNLWLGTETWPAIELEHTEVTKLGANNGMTISPGSTGNSELPLVRPGTTFKGKRVAEVITRWNSKDLFQDIAFEDSDTPGSHTRSIQTEIVDWFTRTFGTRLDLSAMYPCKVTRQTDDLTRVDLLPDDARVKARGLQEVPIRYGIPGAKAKIKNGARVMLGWDAQDPSRPYAAIFEHHSIEWIALAPEADTEVRLTATGTGKVSVTADTTVEVNAPNVLLGDTPGAAVARVGDIVAMTLPHLQAGPFPVAMVPLLPGTIKAVGQVTTGKTGVKA